MRVSASLPALFVVSHLNPLRTLLARGKGWATAQTLKLGLVSDVNPWYHIEHKQRHCIIAALIAATVDRGGWMGEVEPTLSPGELLVDVGFCFPD